MTGGNPVKQEEVISGWRRQAGQSSSVMMLAQPGTVLQVIHSYTCREPLLQAGAMAHPFLWGGPVSLLVTSQVRSLISSREL